MRFYITNSLKEDLETRRLHKIENFINQFTQKIYIFFFYLLL